MLLLLGKEQSSSLDLFFFCICLQHFIQKFCFQFFCRFTHPYTGEKIQFSCPPPPDFAEILSQLREIGTEKVSSN